MFISDMWRETVPSSPGLPYAWAMSMGGPASQLMTEILLTISVLNTWISSHGWFSSQLRTMWKASAKCSRKSRNSESGFLPGMCPVCAPGAAGDMQRQHTLSCFHSVLWYWAAVDLWWGESHGAAVPWPCWPSLAHVVPSLWSPSTGAAPMPSKWGKRWCNFILVMWPKW